MFVWRQEIIRIKHVTHLQNFIKNQYAAATIMKNEK